MGNNQSIINITNDGAFVAVATSNPTWKRYMIRRVEKRPNSIKFFLDGEVKYSNGYYNYINCDNTYPYYNIHAGDRIETNWYRTEDYNSWHEFVGSDNLRAIRFQQRLHSYARALPSRSGRELFRIPSIEALFLLGILEGPGEIIVERKTEWQGDVEVEYIEKVNYSDSEVRYVIETRNIHYAR